MDSTRHSPASRHYEVSLFANLQGMQDFEAGEWRIGLPPCCACNECKAAYAAGWAAMQNGLMISTEEPFDG